MTYRGRPEQDPLYLEADFDTQQQMELEWEEAEAELEWEEAEAELEWEEAEAELEWEEAEAELAYQAGLDNPEPFGYDERYDFDDEGSEYR